MTQEGSVIRPGWRQASGHRRGRQPQRRPSPSKRRTVLVVDDDADVGGSVRDVIERFIPGTEVVLAQSTPQGLALVQSKHVDLILVDYLMPGRNGLEFLARLHELEPGIPVVMMTGVADIEVAARAINRHGVRAFLPKPFDAVVLAETVRDALEKPRR